MYTFPWTCDRLMRHKINAFGTVLYMEILLSPKRISGLVFMVVKPFRKFMKCNILWAPTDSYDTNWKEYVIVDTTGAEIFELLILTRRTTTWIIQKKRSRSTHCAFQIPPTSTHTDSTSVLRWHTIISENETLLFFLNCRCSSVCNYYYLYVDETRDFYQCYFVVKQRFLMI